MKHKTFRLLNVLLTLAVVLSLLGGAALAEGPGSGDSISCSSEEPAHPLLEKAQADGFNKVFGCCVTVDSGNTLENRTIRIIGSEMPGPDTAFKVYYLDNGQAVEITGATLVTQSEGPSSIEITMATLPPEAHFATAWTASENDGPGPGGPGEGPSIDVQAETVAAGLENKKTGYDHAAGFAITLDGENSHHSGSITIQDPPQGFGSDIQDFKLFWLETDGSVIELNAQVGRGNSLSFEHDLDGNVTAHCVLVWNGESQNESGGASGEPDLLFKPVSGADDAAKTLLTAAVSDYPGYSADRIAYYTVTLWNNVEDRPATQEEWEQAIRDEHGDNMLGAEFTGEAMASGRDFIALFLKTDDAGNPSVRQIPNQQSIPETSGVDRTTDGVFINYSTVGALPVQSPTPIALLWLCGHKLAEVPAVAATCEKEGSIAHYACEWCGTLFADAEGGKELAATDTIAPKTEHVWDDGVVTTEPTIEAEGVRTYTCTVCKTTRTEVLPKLESKVVTKSIQPTEALANAGYGTAQAIEDKLVSTLTVTAADGTGYAEDNTFTYEVELQVSLDGGETWIPATEENFPDGGLTILLPYPSEEIAQNYEKYDFSVAHMFGATMNGHTAGETEVFSNPEKTPDGLRVTVTSLSPFAVAWKESAAQTDAPAAKPAQDKGNPSQGKGGHAPKPGSSPRTGDGTVVAPWLVLFALCGAGAACLTAKKRRG